MFDAKLNRRGVLGIAAAVTGAAALPVGLSGPAAASTDTSVTAWLDRNAVPLPRLDAGGRIDDLKALRGIVADASIVGLGEPSHGGRELFTLRHRALRYLVERMGFRTIAFEETFGNGLVMDRYIAGGAGDVRQIVSKAGTLWANEAMVSLLVWLRCFNRGLPPEERVRFLGTDLVQLRQLNFDELRAHVAAVAPEAVAEIEGHLAPIGMHGEGSQHVTWYLTRSTEERAVLTEHARAVRALVAGLPDGPSTVDAEFARQHARVICGFYEFYLTNDRAMRDLFMADAVDWSRGLTGHKTVYWGANSHTGAHPEATYSVPPRPPVTLPGAGFHLRQRHGRGYLSIAVIFDHGELYAGWETGSPRVYAIPAPRAGTTDEILGRAKLPNYLVDLRATASPTVARWLDSPAEFRLVSSAYDPARDAEYFMKVGSIIDGYDALMHIRRTAAAVPVTG
ncbi:erythromycin esterase family protein [Phytomonospora sp. NPDC050363]|uniref:erythromycin esterase family protein n=1 Tax=Phytomonospora sp. NPDC050363 TaxID=3155642 RepID=UPI0033EBCD4E